MYRKTVLMTLLALAAVTVIPCFASAVEYLNLDPTKPSMAQLELKQDNQDFIRFEWNAGGLFLDHDQEEAKVYVATELGINRDVTRQEIGGLVKLPWGYNAELVVVGGEITPVSIINGAGDATSLENGPQDVKWATLGKPAVFRDVTVAPLTIQPVVDEDGTIWMATNLEVEIVVTDKIDELDSDYEERPISRAFYPVYESLLLNGLDELGYRLAETHGSFVIVGYEGFLAEMNDLIEWKRQLGYNVVLHSFGVNQAPSFNELRTILADYYETLEPQLEYVLLVGDENRGTDPIGSDRIVNPNDTNENDVTDWPLTFLEGDDYFPEFFVGRMPVSEVEEARKASRRVVLYERDPDVDADYWSHFTMVAANFAEGPLRPLTPIATSQWLRERALLDWGFEEADFDTLFHREGGYQPTADEISASINQGSIWVTYRGWGDSGGWVFPSYRSADVDNLVNSHMLPVVLSCVCNTGDFGNLVNPKCFATHWITAGTSNTPVGAVSVIAPSDLHTQTKFNNPILSGFMTGVYDEGMRNISQALMRGKWEIYLGHPNARNIGSSVEFYFGVYHVFGDPTLNMWAYQPKLFDITAPETVPYGQASLELTINSPLGNGLAETHVQIRQGDEFFSRGFADESGIIYLPMTGIEPGEIEITVSRDNYMPEIFTLDVVEEAQYVGLDDWTVDSVVPGESARLSLTLENTGTEAQTGVSATITSVNAELVTISTADATFGGMAAGATADNIASPFEFEILEPLPDGTFIEFDLEITGSAGGPWTSTLAIPLYTLEMQYDSYQVTSGTYAPGQTATLELTFSNLGSIEAENITAVLDSWDDAVEVTTAEVAVPSIPANGEVSLSWDVSVLEGAYNGRIVRYGVFFSAGDALFASIPVSIALEGATSTDPLGPDGYGYFAYDDTDTGFDNADETVPTYQWFDIETNGGTDHALLDDDLFYIDLPFDFTFYGVTYPEGTTITVTSNGFIEFTEADYYHRLYFRNWQIPGALGGRAMIAPFWDDLKPPSPELRTHVYTMYSEVGGVFIIEYHSWNRYAPAPEETFAIVLYEEHNANGDGVIDIMYNDVEDNDDDNNGATIGIQDEMHVNGIQYLYAHIYPTAAAPLENGRAIRFTTTAPDNHGPVDNDIAGNIPDEFRLYGNYPNPFNSFTEIRYDIVQAGKVNLSIYNVLGQKVATLVNRDIQPGSHTISFDAGSFGMSSGLYLVRLESDGKSALSKMVYMK